MVPVAKLKNMLYKGGQSAACPPFAVSLLYGFFTICSPYAVWKCAHNCQSRGWTSIARILVVFAPIIIIA